MLSLGNKQLPHSSCPMGQNQLINTFVGKANYCSTGCALQENVVSKQLTLYMSRKRLINMLLTAKCELTKCKLFRVALI